MAAAGWFAGLSYSKGYSLAIGLTLILMLAVRRGYACAPFSISWLSVAVGVLGVFVWIGLWRVDQEYLGLGSRFGSSRVG